MLKRRPIRIGIAIIILGALFKIMHWPGANLIFMIGCITTILIQLVSFILTKPKKPRDYIISTFIVSFVTYYMLKVLHWPWSIIPLSIAAVAMITALVYQLVFTETDVLQTKVASKNTRLIYLIATALIIIGALLKILHWPMADASLIAGLGLFAFYLLTDLFRR